MDVIGTWPMLDTSPKFSSLQATSLCIDFEVKVTDFFSHSKCFCLVESIKEM